VDVISVIIPNIVKPNTFPLTLDIPGTGRTVTINSSEDWNDWKKWRISVQELASLTKLNLFPDFSKNIQHAILSKSLGGSAFLLADPQITPNSTAVYWTNSDTSIGQSSIPEKSIEGENKVQIYGISQDCIDQNGVFQIGSIHSGITQNSISQVGSIQIDSSKITACQICPPQTGVPEISTIQLGIPESSPRQVSTSQVGSTQIGISKASTSQVDTNQIGSIALRGHLRTYCSRRESTIRNTHANPLQ
jgi:hypothetical protein